MPRAVRVIPAASADGRPIGDSLILGFDARRAPQGVHKGVNGTLCELALAPGGTLRMGDVIELDDGTLVEVVAEAEPLVEARARDLNALARLAWYLGDRHVPVQILANRLRLRRDPAIEALLARLGAKVVVIEAPFDPEGGAYAVPAHGHLQHDEHHEHHEHHDHAHGHDHGHAHHHHGREK